MQPYLTHHFQKVLATGINGHLQLQFAEAIGLPQDINTKGAKRKKRYKGIVYEIYFQDSHILPIEYELSSKCPLA